jgi:hypothetical protein
LGRAYEAISVSGSQIVASKTNIVSYPLVAMDYEVEKEIKAVMKEFPDYIDYILL